MLPPGAVLVNKSTVPVGTADAHRRAARPPGRRGGQQPGVPARGQRGARLPEPGPDRRRLRPARRRRAGRRAVRPARRADRAHRRGQRRDDQVRGELLPGHEAVLRQRARRAVRAARTPTSPTSPRAWATTSRIGQAFLSPGPGWGGSCLPKDTHALLQVADAADFEFRLLRATIDTNTRQRQRIVDKIRAAVTGQRGGSLTRRRLGPARPDVQGRHRRPARLTVARGRRAAAAGRAPSWSATTRRCPPAARRVSASLLTVVDDPYLAAKDADAVVILTEWPQFRDAGLGARWPPTWPDRSSSTPATCSTRTWPAGPASPGSGWAARPGPSRELRRSVPDPREVGPGQPTGATVALTAAGVTVLIDATGGRLPAVLHWGHELPALDAEQAEAIRTARVPVIGSNNADVAAAGGRAARAPRRLAGPARALRLPGRAVLVAAVHHDLGAGGRRGRSSGFVSDRRRAGGGGRGGRRGRRWSCCSPSSCCPAACCARGPRSPTPPTTTTASTSWCWPTRCRPRPRELLDFGGRHNRERIPQRRPFGIGTHLRENRKGRTGADSAYLLHAGTPGLRLRRRRDLRRAHRRGAATTPTTPSGCSPASGCSAAASCCCPGRSCWRRARPTGARGSTARTAPGWTQVAAPVPPAPARPPPTRSSADRPVTLNVWEAVYFDHDQDRLLDLAERAAAVGVERYVLDDGWFGARRDDRAGLGDWVVSAEVWPRRAASADRPGAQAGHAVRAVVRAGDGQPRLRRGPGPPRVDHGGAPGVADRGRATSRCSTWASRRPTSTSRSRCWPCSTSTTSATSSGTTTATSSRPATAPDGGRPGVHAQTLAFYRLIDELKAAHPGLEIESCSSGGARVDLGVLERTDRVWVSDCIDPHERQAMLRWTAAAGPAGVPGLAHRLRPLAHHRAGARPRLPGRHRDLRPPRHRVGPGRRHRAGAGRAARLDQLLQGAPGPAAGRRPGADGRAGARSCWCTAWSRPTGPGRSSRMATMTSSTRPGQPAAAAARAGPGAGLPAAPGSRGSAPVRPDRTPVVGRVGGRRGAARPRRVPAGGPRGRRVPGSGLHRGGARAHRDGLPDRASRSGRAVLRHRAAPLSERRELGTVTVRRCDSAVHTVETLLARAGLPAPR